MRVGLGLRGDVDVVDHRDRAAPRAARRPGARAARSAAGFISAQWKGADTASGSARLAPVALSSSQALSTPALAAGDHGLLGVVEVGRRDHLAAVARGLLRSPRARRRRPGRGWPPSRRCPPAPRPAWPGRESAPAAARRPGVSAPAATSALYSPSECPATAAGAAPPSAQPGAVAGDRRRQHHRLGVGGQRRACPSGRRGSARPMSSPSAAEASASVAAHGRVVAPGVEHADGLRALAGKDECERCHGHVSMPARHRRSAPPHRDVDQ